MGRGPLKWTETLITRLTNEGRGRGQGPEYQPWLRVDAVSSLGRSRRVWCPKVRRTIHLLSDVEYHLFLALEWQMDVVGIREQFPLDRALTQDIARSLGIRHPFYPGTHVPTVMTADLLVTRVVGAARTVEAYNAKRDEEAGDEASLLKLEIQRSYFELTDATHHLVYHSQIPRQKVDNIDWIRDSLLKDGEVEPSPGYYAGMCTRMAAELEGNTSINVSLAKYCSDFDARYGAERGTGLRVAKMLMHERALKPNLASKDLAAEPMSSFVMTAQPGRLRSVGGQ